MITIIIMIAIIIIIIMITIIIMIAIIIFIIIIFISSLTYGADGKFMRSKDAQCNSVE